VPWTPRWGVPKEAQVARKRTGAEWRRGTRLTAAGLTVTVAAALLSGCGTGGAGTVVNVYAPADGADTVKIVGAQCSNDTRTVDVHVLPKDADGQRLQLARRLNGNDRTLDIMGMDVTWTAEFATAGWALPVPDDLQARADATMLGGPLKSARWQDRLYAIPAWTNTQLLWFRKDVLAKVTGRRIGVKPPKLTWDQLLQYAAKSKDQGGPAQIEVPAAQYEGLVVWFNAVLESAGGRLIADDGKTVTLTDTPEHRAATVKALTIMKQIATAPGHDPSFTQLKEGEARLAMESGKAIFELNWPFVFAGIKQNAAAGTVPFLTTLSSYNDLLNPPKDATNPPDPTAAQLKQINDLTRQKFDFAPFPSVMPGKPGKSPLGGINFAVAKTTRHADLAFSVLDCLTNAQAGRQYALKGGTPPVFGKLYDDPEFVKAYPMASLIRDQLQTATASVRPLTPLYVALSTQLQAELAPVGGWDPETMADRLTSAAQQAMSGKGLVP
jgi:multiple sugar transport system substrate-binding protein